MDEDVAQFLSVTGLDSEHVARGYLEISGNDPMQAIQLFFENPDLASSFVAQPAPASAAPAPPAPAAASVSSSRSVSAGRGWGARGLTTGREDARGVIHIDSDGDDDDDVDMDRPAGARNHITIPDDPDEHARGQDHHDIAAVARAAQEEEDAAMARRLQDDMYSQDPGSADGVRAPMARTTETLVAPDPSWSIDDDREAAVLEQLRRRRQPRTARPPPNPFSQSVWDDPGAAGGGDEPVVPMASRPGGTPAASTSRSQRLADLFRPPFDIMSHLAWDDARQEGKEEKKWIMVNVQDMSDFNCQALNRDHWKDPNIKALLREHFIFLQYEKGDPLSQTYTSFYFHGFEDRDNYPYVSIIDPRTGEQVKTWSGLPFPDAAELHNDLVEFLDRYSLAANSKNPVPTSKPKAKPVDYGRMTEEEMMEMALKNSLEANGGSRSRPGVQDPDELTRAQAEAAAGASASGSASGSGTGTGMGAPHSPAPLPAAASPFEQISATRPHTEPANDPTTTTRIQFRHPAGRVIRRFAVDDAVRRIYEWLKADALEGKQGVPFELKANPGGDLIDRLDMTIDEAGLKQGTVMIEFIEDDA